MRDKKHLGTRLEKMGIRLFPRCQGDKDKTESRIDTVISRMNQFGDVKTISCRHLMRILKGFNQNPDFVPVTVGHVKGS